MNGESSRYDKLESMLENGGSKPHNVPLKYLRNITNNFSHERLLGEGGFGTVYKGVLQNRETIAVKKLNSSIMPGVKDRQFENEASHLMRLKHPNVVLLVGWCSETQYIPMEYNGTYVCTEKSERLLCLEYMPNGNLRGYLSDESSGLGWDTRYKIIEGICYGLRYLHEEWKSNTPIVHMDLKPANILLDNNMVPKIADFGLSRLFSEEKTSTCTRSRDGSLGYMSPEYINKGLVSTKSDIFSLGVIIIEIVTGRRDYPDDTGTPSEKFIEMVLHNWNERTGVSIEADYQQIRRCIQIGLDCVKTDRSKRPTISEIIKTLHGPESADSSNIKGVHGPQSGKRERNFGETNWMERLAKKHAPDFSIYETFSVALHQWQRKTALRRIRVIFTAVVFVFLFKKRGGPRTSVEEEQGFLDDANDNNDGTEPSASMIEASFGGVSFDVMTVVSNSGQQAQRRHPKMCRIKGCSRGARGTSGSCIAHGGRMRCQKPGCCKRAESPTAFCKAHDEAPRCNFPRCTLRKEGKTNFCIPHGGGVFCSYTGCTKPALVKSGRSMCIMHGGGKRCSVQGCTRSAEAKVRLCISHGGGASSRTAVVL